ncbi:MULTISPECIES: hypothetical protein [unclassified Imperialibacter]|uniref:hypothetical protein n=1 Tax=unclassified Imperialibacter TaxID=2629706 RepID=UPI001252FA9C|nr:MULTISPECIES: hypothetical protein [unclassified Imperialibacter]CAD5270937.1 hypothetical protein IMPERIA89_340477 [Imperialibacter sp. 89]CAD5298521.1 hypothetical protein IMPERIA75_700476 [Imperialibacter sp. 75]VVT34945.1 hypothetical protein IMPR6_700071 [Imperialibacter sp. EC-SDR9]
MNKTILFSGLLFFTLIGCKHRVVVDAPAILRHSPEEVEAILGKPDSTYASETLAGPALAQHFKMYNVEVEYVDNKASYISVKGPHGLPFSEEALEAFNAKALGEPTKSPDEKVMRWIKMQAPIEAISFAATHYDSLQNVDNFTVTIIGRK